ncbi:MAG: DUF2807 domain-containing protein [Deltaproteobacteria bacterium]|nr:DUF2807 domain-containing protein [Deltaproteobacteria bacterium]
MRFACASVGIAVGLAAGCIFTNDIDGNGVSTEEERSVEVFGGVAAASNVDVDIEIDDPPSSVTITCDSNLHRYIETDVDRRGVLVVAVREDTRIDPRTDCFATVVHQDPFLLEASGSGDIDCRGIVPDLESVIASGSGNIETNRAWCQTLEVSNTGSGNIDLPDLRVGVVEVTSSGSGTTTLVGEPSYVDVVISGSGPVLARELQAFGTTVASTGSGDTEVYASDWVDLTLSGSGDVDVWGSPPNRDEAVTGSGTVNYH